MSKIIQYENNYISLYNMENDNVRINPKKYFLKNNVCKTKKNIFKKIFICYLLVLFILLLLNIFQKNHIDNKNKLIKNKEKTNFNIIFYEINKKKKIKLCICTLGREENKYIKEFVEFYEKHGIDKIFLYDYNDIDGENFEEVIKDYIDKGFVEILNWRGTKLTQNIILDHCYAKNKNKFDWLFFYDIDEYIHLNNYTNIKDYLNKEQFDNCLKIYLNLVVHTDNNMIYYDNRSLHERFPDTEKNYKNKNQVVSKRVKCILRGHYPNDDVNGWALMSEKYKGCNGYGKKAKLINRVYFENRDFKNYYIDHYYSKSLEEYINIVNKEKGEDVTQKDYKKLRIKKYFKINEITLEKIEFIEKKTGIKLNNFRKRLKLKKDNRLYLM